MVSTRRSRSHTNAPKPPPARPPARGVGGGNVVRTPGTKMPAPAGNPLKDGGPSRSGGGRRPRSPIPLRDGGSSRSGGGRRSRNS